MFYKLFTILSYLSLSLLVSSNIVTVDIVRPLFYETQSDLRAIVVSIDKYSIYRDRLIINVNQSDNANTLFPNHLVFAYESDKTQYIGFTAGRSGKNKIIIELYGINSLDYTIEFVNDNDIITILNDDIEPPKPVPKSAFFSNDGTSVIIEFDTKTNQGGYENVFPCDNLLYFNGDSSSICSWINNTHIEMLDATLLRVGTDITIQGNKILPYCEYMTCISNFIDQTTLYISSPIYPIKPTISISTSTVIGGCNSIILDLSGSIGSGGRAWKNIAFSVNSTDTNGAINIEKFLNEFYIISPPTPISNSLLTKGNNYTFQIDMCNFLNICSSISSTIEVLSSTDVPVVNIIGQQLRTIKSSDVLLLSSSAYTSSCDGQRATTTTDGLTYSWSIYLNDIIQPLNSESKDMSKFKLSSNKLIPGNNYVVSLTVTNIAKKKATVSTIVSVIFPPLIIDIKGGQRLTVNAGDIVTIDASSTQSNLQYTWDCIKIYPSLGECTLNGDLNVNDDKLFLSSNDYAVDSVNRVTVNVVDKSMTSRIATTYVDITIASKNAPEVTITTPSKELTSVDASKNIVINGFVSLKRNFNSLNDDSCNATWNMNGKNIIFNLATIFQS